MHVLPQFLFRAKSHTSLELGLQAIPIQPKVEDIFQLASLQLGLQFPIQPGVEVKHDLASLEPIQPVVEAKTNSCKWLTIQPPCR